jgi:hypothetical protein
MPSLEAAQTNFIATINEGPDVLDQSLFDGPVERVLLGLKAHANTINHARLVALEDSFPLGREAMGDAKFNALSRAFIETSQAKSCDLNDIGRSFAEFLKVEQAENAICDLAAIEWAWLESYHAADAMPLTLGDIGMIDGAALLALEVRLHPATRLVQLNAPLAAPLGHLAEGKPAAILIIRPEAEVRLLALDAITAATAEKCTSPTTIGNLLSTASEQGDEADPIGPVMTLIGAGALVSME